MQTTDPIARAFELARSGTCHNLVEIRTKLRKEGYPQVEEHFQSASLKSQLNDLIKASHDSSGLPVT